ncbi:MAG: hypothetical protein ACTSRS_07195 [Candidatus Helarchaeota archaeon]
MDESFPKQDRELFQLLIDYPLESLENLVKISKTSSISTLYRRIKAFCERYQCGERIQICNWEQIGLQSFFILSDKPLMHPYKIRQYEIIGKNLSYLTQFVTPNLQQIPETLGEIYPVTHIYRPTNEIQLLYDEARTISFNDDWLLNLKEVMYEQEIGDVIYYEEPYKIGKIEIDNQFLQTLSKLYLTNIVGRFRSYKEKRFIQTFRGFIEPYFEIKISGMVDYILILDETDNPKLFVGGFLGKFPLVELFEGPNSLICHFQLPDPNYSKLNLILHTHLIKVCNPHLWLLVQEKRFFQLEEQWTSFRWQNFIK